MQIDVERLEKFEKRLDPQNLQSSAVSATVLGYGEISSIFEISQMDGIAFKRMPLFKDVAGAEKYAALYKEYCQLLKTAGLQLPEDETIIVNSSAKLVVLYIVQQKFTAGSFCHNLIHNSENQDCIHLFNGIVTEIEKVWRFNELHSTETELSIDGQLSNWVRQHDQFYFIDTSTPLFRKNGMEQLDPELLLQSAPGFLRWILRLFFLDDVMNRYYDRRQVYIDLAANLHKEQRPDLIPVMLKIINRNKPETMPPLTEDEINKYYKEDKRIWTLFLAFRKIDRWLTTKLFRKTYNFILPGKIKR